MGWNAPAADLPRGSAKIGSDRSVPHAGTIAERGSARRRAGWHRRDTRWIRPAEPRFLVAPVVAALSPRVVSAVQNRDGNAAGGRASGKQRADRDASPSPALLARETLGKEGHQSPLLAHWLGTRREPMRSGKPSPGRIATTRAMAAGWLPVRSARVRDPSSAVCRRSSCRRMRWPRRGAVSVLL